MNNISYLWVIDIDEKYYDYDSYSQDSLIKKYFILSYIKKQWYKEAESFEEKLSIDIISDFPLWEDESKLKLLYFLWFSWEIDNFLQKVSFNLNEIQDKDNIYYLYLSNKLNVNSDELLDISSNFKDKYDELNDLEKVLFIWYLYESKDDDFEIYYDKFELKNNYDLDLDVAFSKYLIYSNFENEYSSFENDAKFWYASWILLNRKKEFILDSQNINHIDSLSLDKVMYDWLIDTRVKSFEGDKIYLNVIVKEK